MSEERIAWERVGLDKEELSRLNGRSDFRGFLQCISLLAVVTVTGSFIWWSWVYNRWFLLPALFFHGTVIGFFSPAAAVHELSHGTPFKSRFWNEFFIRIFSFISWTNYVHFRASHQRHHRFTVHDVLDQEVVLPRTVTWLNLVSFFSADLRGLGLAIWNNIQLSFGRFNNGWDQIIFPESDLTGRKEVVRWSQVVVWGHFLLLVVFAVTGNWILIPIVVVPQYFPWLSAMCGVPQHAGLPSNVNDFRKCCRTMILDPVSSYLYWNMNYHVEHHMYPAVPFFRLPQLHERIRADCPVPCKGLIAAWREIFYAQKMRRTDPGYTIDAFSRV